MSLFSKGDSQFTFVYEERWQSSSLETFTLRGFPLCSACLLLSKLSNTKVKHAEKLK